MMKRKLIKSGTNCPTTEKDQKKIISGASKAFGKFLDELGFDWENDPNMKGTPDRVAKMWVKEIAKGCYSEPPKITAFENVDKYAGMVFQGNITVKSMCSHHTEPFFGVAHVAYIPSNDESKIIGLSKLNRIVDWFSRRPQVQENLTTQIHNYINDVLGGNLGVAVQIESKHMCVYLRGIEHDSVMKTTVLSGAFKTNETTRDEFVNYVRDLKKL